MLITIVDSIDKAYFETPWVPNTMDTMKKEGVLIVPKNGHYAFEIEARLKGRGVSCMVIPTPKDLSSECGVSLLVSRGFLHKGVSLLEEECGGMLSGIYLVPELLPLTLKGAKA